MLGLGSKLPRAPPSGANPSTLVGQPIATEDDVLHVRSLPDFGGRLKARDCELLLSYLTVPYLRVPLVLQFFADPGHVHALAVRGGSLLATALGTEMLPASQTGAMVNVRVPCERATTKDGCGGKLGISTRLFRKYNFYVPFWGLADQGTWVRLSAQIFLELSDFQMVADAIIADLGL